MGLAGLWNGSLPGKQNQTLKSPLISVLRDRQQCQRFPLMEHRGNTALSCSHPQNLSGWPHATPPCSVEEMELSLQVGAACDSCCCCCLVTKSCLAFHGLQHTGFPVLHHLLEFAQTHVHCVGDAIQPSDPLSSPFPPAFSLSQHQGLFQ